MSKQKKTYRSVKYGAVTFKTVSKAVAYYLSHTNLSQTEIAEKVGCTQGLVSQISSKLL